jgi:molybdopterin-containing oxidoreductase family membrane subunit
MKQFMFDDKAAFLAKLQELLKTGVPASRIEIVTPIPVHEAIHLLQIPPSKLRNFTFPAAFTGTFAGVALTLGTVYSWPLITGGKSMYSLVPFLVISFELTILFGAIASFAGMLHLNRLPDIKQIIQPQETGNQYAIFVEDKA